MNSKILMRVAAGTSPTFEERLMLMHNCLWSKKEGKVSPLPKRNSGRSQAPAIDIVEREREMKVEERQEHMIKVEMFYLVPA